MTEFKDCFWGVNGFEELKKYMRLGNEFCKDLASILTERADHELNYSKGLNKTSLRLQKLSKDFHGGLSEAWLQVSIQFDIEAEMHKTLASALQEEIIRPLKILAENQTKCRKPVETRVEKVIKCLADKKADDYKYRSRCFQLVKDIEKSMYSLDEAQKGVGGKPPNQKEIQRIESQIVKTKEYLEKSEVKYHKACAAVELARQDWQTEALKGCIQMQSIESDRISSLEQLIKKLTIQINLLSKKMFKIVEVFQSIAVDVKNDIQLACKKYGTCANEQEIYLLDVYAENTKNMMNRERRVANLTRWSELLNIDVQSQVKARQGIDKVKHFAKENPNFSTNNDVEIGQKEESVRFMHMLYEASLFKIQSALSDLFGNPKPSYQYSHLVHTTYDRQGVPLTILKIAPNFESNAALEVAGATAPSPPSSPKELIPSGTSSRSNGIGLYESSQSTLSICSSSSIYASQISQQPTIISMPMPYGGYEASNSVGNYAAGECSSASSISTSSVSPAALSSSSSSHHHSQSSPQQQQQQTTNFVQPRSSYLLTTAASSSCSTTNATTTNSNNNNNITNSFLNDNPPPYPIASNTKQSSVLNTIENHYNNSNQSLSDDDDEDEWNEAQYTFVGRCIAQYDYKGARDDELNLKLGDPIDIIEKRTDGWWRGQLNNTIGLFPSTYVKEQILNK